MTMLGSSNHNGTTGELASVKHKLSLLDQLHDYETSSEEVLKRRLELMREIVVMLADEIDSLGFVRSINIRQGIDMHDEMRRFEIHLVQSALERTGGHLTNAAKLLGINLTTLHNKIKRLNISVDNLVSAPILHEDIPPQQTMHLR
jgi:transcriptional regulator with GAF, ATPase, and Fis domain